MTRAKSRRTRHGPPQSVPATALRSRRVWLGPVLIACAAVVAFGNSVFAPFVLDDQISILDNPTLVRLWPITDALFAHRESPLAGRPLVNLSFAVNYAIAGLEPRLYHAGNVALHVGCGLLLWAVVRRTWLLP